MATINLLTDAEQHQVATYGFDGGVCSYDDSMCTAVIEGGSAIVTYDDREDDRYQESDATGVEIGHGPDAKQPPVTDQHGGVTTRAQPSAESGIRFSIGYKDYTCRE